MVNLPAVVLATVRRYDMFQPGQALLVAVSGGADSAALLHVLAALSAEMSLRLGVAHLNHELRGAESAADERFVVSLAAEYQLPCYTETVDTRRYAAMQGLSLEDAGRRLRYRFLLDTARCHAFDRVAVGHHRDDNAESVLMGLLRGSGPAGLSGIAPVRADGIIRPLIRLSRRHIRDYLRSHGLAFVADRTNNDVSLLRNRLRLELLPMLATVYNPSVSLALNRIASILKAEDQWLSELVAPLYADMVLERQDGVVGLSLAGFARMHAAAKRRIVRLAVAEVKGDLRSIGFTHVEAVLRLAETTGGGSDLSLPASIRVRRSADRIEFSNLGILKDDRRGAGGDSAGRPYRYELAAPGTIEIRETGERIAVHPVEIQTVPVPADRRPETAYIDADRVRFPMTIRNRRPGDRFSPLGTAGTQKLKKYFCDHKIPSRRRRSCPLLLSEDRIVWVAGERIDNAVKLTAATRRVLKAELLPARNGPAGTSFL